MSGLFFTKQHLDTARKNSKREPFKSAFAFLEAKHDFGLMETAHLDALRYQIHGAKSKTAGHRAVETLQSAQLRLPENAAYLDHLRFTVAFIHLVEMLLDHPLLGDQMKQQSIDLLVNQVKHLNQIDHNLPLHEAVWLALVNTAGGVVLQRDDLFQDGVNLYKQVIDTEIHPQGYIQSIVEIKDGYSLHRFLLTLQGLSLIAEAVTNTGTDLWKYHNRGVSLMTAGLYPLYYYFYPEQWKWDAPLPEDETKNLFRHYGSYLEILNFRMGRATKAIDLILADLRPVFDIYGGGLTTLTHGVRRGWFG